MHIYLLCRYNLMKYSNTSCRGWAGVYGFPLSHTTFTLHTDEGNRDNVWYNTRYHDSTLRRRRTTTTIYIDLI